jgi:hypothetical protein
MFAYSASRCCSTRFTYATAEACGTTRAARDRIDDPLGLDLAPDRFLERGLVDARLPQQPLVEVERELAALLKAGIGSDAVEDLGVGGTEVQIGALLFDQALAQHLLNEIEAHLGIVEDRGVDTLRRAPQLFLLVAIALANSAFGDPAAVELRDFARSARAAESSSPRRRTRTES